MRLFKEGVVFHRASRLGQDAVPSVLDADANVEAIGSNHQLPVWPRKFESGPQEIIFTEPATAETSSLAALELLAHRLPTNALNPVCRSEFTAEDIGSMQKLRPESKMRFEKCTDFICPRRRVFNSSAIAITDKGRADSLFRNRRARE
jgi:hypothetical protein